MIMSVSKYYHYTDERGAYNIANTMTLRASTGGALGRGVYLTKMPPSESRSRIAENNYDGYAAGDGHLGDIALQRGRIDYVVEMELPDDYMIRDRTLGRDVYLYPDRDLDLTQLTSWGIKDVDTFEEEYEGEQEYEDEEEEEDEEGEDEEEEDEEGEEEEEEDEEEEEIEDESQEAIQRTHEEMLLEMRQRQT